VVISLPNGGFGESSWNSREGTGMPPMSPPSNDLFSSSSKPPFLILFCFASVSATPFD